MVNWCCRYYQHQETGFYYLQSRYYDPEICRFINADSLIITNSIDLLGANMFAYCKNNPINFEDIYGTYSFLCRECDNYNYSPEASSARDKARREYAKSKYNSTNVAVLSPGDNVIPGAINVIVNPDYHREKDGALDPNIQIIDSYKIRDKYEMEAILEVVMGSPLYDENVYKRSVHSYIIEWDAHNWAYDALISINKVFSCPGAIESARSVDLDELEDRMIIFDSLYFLWG